MHIIVMFCSESIFVFGICMFRVSVYYVLTLWSQNTCMYMYVNYSELTGSDIWFSSAACCAVSNWVLN